VAQLGTGRSVRRCIGHHLPVVGGVMTERIYSAFVFTIGFLLGIIAAYGYCVWVMA
jgi:hypothetical protein